MGKEKKKDQCIFHKNFIVKSTDLTETTKEELGGRREESHIIPICHYLYN